MLMIDMDAQANLTSSMLNGDPESTVYSALTASTDIIIPLVAEVLPFKGLAMMNNFIRMVQKKLNERAHVTGILITRWENTKLGRGVESQLRESLGSKVFTTKIRKNVSLAEAPYEVKDIVTYAPKSNGAADYMEFVSELVEKVK